MALERVGPGGVSNSYGVRTGNKPTLMGQANSPQGVYNEYRSEGVISLTRNVCSAGDSIAEQNTSIIAGANGNTYVYNARGPVVWMQNYLGWPWEYEPEDNYAVFGSTLDAIIATQLPRILLANRTKRYLKCFLSCVTNDTNAGTSVETIKENLTILFSRLLDNGIMPVHTGVRPRGNDVAMTDAKRKNQQINEWIYQQSLLKRCEFIDVTEVYADNSTAFGNTLASMMYDSTLHPNSRGANLEGLAMAQYYIANGVTPGIRFSTQQSDVFERTNNPTGVAFNAANPLLQGTTGTLAGGATGQVPTGMTGTAGAWAKVNRTLANGQVRTDAQVTLAAATLHHLYDDWIGSGAWGATQLQPGDIIEARVKIVLASAVNVKNVQLRLTETNGTGTGLDHYGTFATTDDCNLQGNHTLYLKTPRIPIRNYTGVGNVNIFARAEVLTIAGASGTATIQGFDVRRYIS